MSAANRYLALGVLAALAFAGMAPPAHARQPACVETGSQMRPSCMGQNVMAGVKSVRVKMHKERHPTNPRHRQARQSAIVAHPAGCPARAFCGCGAAVRIFGKPIRYLWLAANWFRFPRTVPAPGMVAVRRHHVFVLESHLGGDIWLAFDANSGGHRTRIHARSIAGYSIVNPRA